MSEELRAASDAVIDDAVSYADPMVLRGLLHQLTGDPEVAGTRVTPQVSIDAARLARIMKHQVPAKGGYYLCYPPALERDRRIKNLRTWMLAEAAGGKP